MEESKKKALMIGIVVVCLAAAAMIFYKTHSGSSGGGLESLSDEAMTWVLCRNPDCETSYEMGLKVYFKLVQENLQPMSMAATPLVCEKCSELSIYRAVKCEKCGLVFERGTMGAQEFADRCPDCGHSTIEERRKTRVRR